MWKLQTGGLNSPVLYGFRGGGGSQFGHEDSHDVEEENKVYLGKGRHEQTIISGSFVIASCTYTQFPAAGTLIMSGRGRGTSLSSFSKQAGV